MALQAPVKRALACSNCQRWILGSFIAAVGNQTTSVGSAYRTPPPLQRRLLSRTARRFDGNDERIRDEALPLNDINTSVSEQNTPSTTAAPTQPPQSNQGDAHLPWYLRIQSPLPEQSSPLTSRQQLPELPKDPPPLLSPLLEHISTQLGMDSITLLDLRTLDPPPALGSNLLMLIGTARSERHLHVSADKLCRWLRTEHKLSPHADGLLGRGELKILMRRKAKRRRLLSAVNAGRGVGVEGTGEGEVDEGVRTGWVCVNIGSVEGGGGQARESMPSEGVIGFGPAVEGGGAEGCSIVVQLMTEEKRAEVELESLWEGILAKAEKEKARLREHVGRDADVDVGAVHEDFVRGDRSVHAQAEQTRGPTSKGLDATTTPVVSNSTSAEQVRAYHISTHRRRPVVATEVAIDNSGPDAEIDMSLPSAPSSATNTRPETSEQSLTALNSLLTSLKSMPRRSALEALGPDLLQASEHLQIVSVVAPPSSAATATAAGGMQAKHNIPAAHPTNVESTPFLEEFYSTMPIFPTSAHWHVHIELLVHARTLSHPALHSPVLVAQVKNMLISGLIPLQKTFLLVIQSILSPLGARLDGRRTAVDEITFSNNKKRDALGLLGDMEGCGYDCVSGEVLDILNRAFVRGKNSMGDELDFKSFVRNLELARLRRLASTCDWPAFWRTWRSYPQRFLPRSSEMYVIILTAVADGKLLDPESSAKERVVAFREAKEVVWSCLEEMEMEDPPVEVEGDGERELARAVRGAVEWCEPGLGKESEEGGARGFDRGWREWWERCTRALDAKS